jgi:predicted Zn-dependent peptidase
MHIKDFDPYDFSKKEINGTTVYYKNLPWAPCIHIAMTFSIGAFDDPEEREGLAHFLEHMVLSGCPSLPTRKAMREFSKLYMLDSKNAATSYSYTKYTGKCLPEHFRTVIKTMTEYVFTPLLKSEDVDEERKIITQEAWGVYKNIKLLKYTKEIDEAIFHGHERARIHSPLGWPNTVAKITQKDLRDFHAQNYIKENMILVLVGNIEESNLELLDEVLKDLPSGNKKVKNDGTIERPKNSRIEKTSDEIGDPKEQVEFSIIVAGNRKEEENVSISGQAGDLLYDALFERLRTEHSLCYGVSVGWYKGKDHFEGGISVKTDIEKLPLAEKEIWAVIDEIIEGKWKERFAMVHKVYIDQMRSAERTSSSIISSTSSDLINQGKLTTLDERLENAAKVTYEDVVDFIKAVTDKNQIVTEVILPSNK